VVVPSLKVTVPPGTAPVLDLSVAVKVTDSSKIDGFIDETTVEVVVAALIVSVIVDEVLTRKSVLPLYDAVIEWVPTLRLDVV
jgi:hypothetical protein